MSHAIRRRAETRPQDAPAGRYPAHRGRRERLPSLDEALLRAEEILEDTIIARGKSFATADFEILKLSRERSKN